MMKAVAPSYYTSPTLKDYVNVFTYPVRHPKITFYNKLSERPLKEWKDLAKVVSGVLEATLHIFREPATTIPLIKNLKFVDRLDKFSRAIELPKKPEYWDKSKNSNTSFLKIDNIIRHMHYLGYLFGNSLEVFIFMRDYVVPTAGVFANQQMDKLIAFSASFGNTGMNGVTTGLKFLKKVGVDNVKSAILGVAFMAEVYFFYKDIEQKDKNLNPHSHMINNLEILKRITRLTTMSFAISFVFVPVTWGMSMAIILTGLATAGIGLALTLEKNRQKTEKNLYAEGRLI